MIYSAEVVRISDQVEEEVVLRVCGRDLKCFATICPYKIEIGKRYPVIFSLFVLDYSSLRKASKDADMRISSDEEGLSCVIAGLLKDGRLIVDGLVFEDDVLREEFSHLNENMISLTVDRVDVEFIWENTCLEDHPCV